MKIEPDITQGQHKIDAYSAGSITIAGIAYRSNVIVTTGTVIEDCLPDSVHGLAESHISAMLELKPEVVLFGTGKQLTFPADEICQLLYVRQIGFEIMDTGAACRAFNFLSGEGRQIVSALFMIE